MADMTTRAREVEALREWLRNDGLENVNGQWIRSRVSMQKYLAALSALIAECEWRDIASAPKDGTAVLIACGDCVAGEGYYEPERDAWYWANTHWTDASAGIVYPTHWRPLPTPPQPVPVGGEKETE